LPQGPVRDAAAANLASALKQSQPSNALAWAQSISNAEKRLEYTGYVMKAWASSAPQEAANALKTLPPEERQKIFPGK